MTNAMIRNEYKSKVSNVIKIYFTPKNYLTFLNYLYNGKPLDLSTKLMINAMLTFDDGLFTTREDDLFYALITDDELGDNLVYLDLEYAVWTTNADDVYHFMRTPKGDKYYYLFHGQLKRAIDPKKMIEVANAVFDINSIASGVDISNVIGDNTIRVAPMSHRDRRIVRCALH